MWADERKRVALTGTGKMVEEVRTEGVASLKEVVVPVVVVPKLEEERGYKF